MTTVSAILLTALCAGLGCLYSASIRLERFHMAFWLKCAAGLCFIAVGALLSHRTRADILVLAGLCFGLLGDQLLALRRIWPRRLTPMLGSGGVAFAVGHVLYILAILQRCPRVFPAALLFLLIFLALSGLNAVRLRPEPRVLAVPGAVYLALVSFMAAAACGAAAACRSLPGLLMALGSVSFLISDNLLGIQCFSRKDSFPIHRAVHITYYTAQLLIAWSLYR